MPSINLASYENIVLPYSHACTESSDRAPQPSHVKVPLRPHQLAVIERMGTLEKQLQNGLDIHIDLSGCHEFLYSRYGVLGDPSGAGKSLMVLGYISSLKDRQPAQRSHHTLISPFSNRNLYSIVQEEHRDISNCSALIVVPHTLFHQWSQYIQDQTTLKALLLQSKEGLLQTGILTKLISSDVVLISNTLLRDLLFLTGSSGIVFSHMYIDEADTISIPNTLTMPKVEFLWFITAAWKNMVFSNNHIWFSHAGLLGLIESPHYSLMDSDFQAQLQEHRAAGTGFFLSCSCKSSVFFDSYLRGTHPHKSHIVLRCSNAFLQQSVRRPQITTEQILCTRPLTSSLALAFLSPEMQEMLNAENTADVYALLGIKADTPASLLRTLTEKKMIELEEYRREYTYRSALDYDTELDKETAITPSLTKIRGIEEQMDALRERIENYAHEICPICYEEKAASALVTPCCTRIFCAACILQALSKIGTCPLCRTAIQPNTLISVGILLPVPKGNRTLHPVPKRVTKHESLAALLRKYPKEKCLVFSKYEGTFPYLQKFLQEEGISARELKGNSNVLKHILHQFDTEGPLRVLLLKQSTAGLTLPSATCIVFWHSMHINEEQQIMGRMSRFGDGKPLRLVRLVYPEELQ